MTTSQPMMVGHGSRAALLASACYCVAAATGALAAFSQPPMAKRSVNHVKSLRVAVDPSAITKKEYDEICDIMPEEEMMKRLEKQSLLYPKHVEVIKDLEPIADKMVEKILLETGEKSWQPQDFLPDLTQEGWEDDIKDVRKAAASIPDELLVVLVGDMVTEEALPTYQTLLNTFEGCDDPTGTTEGAWGRWSRGWTSEENRHGDLLNKYLYLGGRCDMRSIEVTIQHLITKGFNPNARKDPYRGFVYTSFQERATKISHGNVGRLARKHGDTRLSKICAQIAGDEGRHERAYQTFVTEILKRDPDGLINVFADMMRGQVAMPAAQMTDGVDPDLYDSFATVAQRIGVYTALDYADIIEHLVKTWDLEHVEGLRSDTEKQRDYLCKLPQRYRRLAERSMDIMRRNNDDSNQMQSFSWIQGRRV